MWPAVAFASQAWLFILMIGLFAQIAGLMTFAIILFAVVVLFQLVTLPVEFDASRRAMAQISDLGLVSSGESQGARKVLTAAAMTYVAAALAALSQLAYWLLDPEPQVTPSHEGDRPDRACRAPSSPRARSSSRCSSTAGRSLRRLRDPTCPPVEQPAPKPKPAAAKKPHRPEGAPRASSRSSRRATS